MRGGALPAAMAIAGLALMLGFATRRTIAAALVLAGACLATASFAPVPDLWVEAIFLGCWASVAVSALCTYLPRPVAPSVACLLASFAGMSAGLAIAAEGRPTDVALPILAALLVVPAQLAVAKGYAVAPRIVASWLIAVAVLAAILPHVVTHPGYVPDHRG